MSRAFSIPAITLLATLYASGCDTAPAADLTERVAPAAESAPERTLPPQDCREAYYCFRSCLGAGFVDGVQAVDVYDTCVDSCDPVEYDAHNHFGWWVDAVEAQCEDTWGTACLWDAARPSLADDLSGVVLDGCLRQGTF